MTEFEIDGTLYRSGKMAARTQFHVLRRLAPMTDAVFSLMGRGANDPETVAIFASAIGEISDEATDYVLDRCLAVVEIRQGEAWAKVVASDGKTLMFGKDMDITVQLQILAHVLRDNYGPVFQKALAIFNRGGNPLASIG